VKLVRAIVVVPTFNEREMLPLFVDEFLGSGFELVIVDDNSPDGTGELADRLADEHEQIHVLHRAGKEGLGAAYRAAFAWCLERDYELVGQMDADLSHPVEALARMRAEIDEGADLVLGSRYVAGGGTGDWSPFRRLVSRAGGIPARLVLRLPVADLSGGFKLWRAEALRRIEVETTTSQGYVFQVETTRRAFRAGLRVAQIPFVFRERVAGESKMNVGISLEGIAVVLRLARDRWRPTG
jgi:dolichol-phosphate mannosyltransferase